MENGFSVVRKIVGCSSGIHRLPVLNLCFRVTRILVCCHSSLSLTLLRTLHQGAASWTLWPLGRSAFIISMFQAMQIVSQHSARSVAQHFDLLFCLVVFSSCLSAVQLIGVLSLMQLSQSPQARREDYSQQEAEICAPVSGG